jgi:hypothetical protein
MLAKHKWTLMIYREQNISLTYGAESFLRSRQLCSYSRTSQHLIESKVSLLCSQELRRKYIQAQNISCIKDQNLQHTACINPMCKLKQDTLLLGIRLQKHHLSKVWVSRRNFSNANNFYRCFIPALVCRFLSLVANKRTSFTLHYKK